jgi:integrase
MASLDTQQQAKLLTQVRQVVRSKHYSHRTALNALLFLYRDVLGHDIGNIGQVTRAKQPVRLPVILNREEVRAVLGQLHDEARIAGLLMYGGGLRLLETLKLRVKDIDFPMGQIVVRRAKGGKDRVTVSV